jgi:hypothetical protein
VKQPIDQAARTKLQTEYPGLRYFRHDQDPHYAPAEGFMDDGSATAISFPL